MGKVDTATKAYMRKNNIFADAFNYLIYDGKPVVNPEQLRELDTTEIALPFGPQENGQSNDLVQKYRDILKSAVVMQEDEAAYILLGIENQTDMKKDTIIKFVNDKYQSLKESFAPNVGKMDLCYLYAYGIAEKEEKEKMEELLLNFMKEDDFHIQERMEEEPIKVERQMDKFKMRG